MSHGSWKKVVALAALFGGAAVAQTGQQPQTGQPPQGGQPPQAGQQQAPPGAAAADVVTATATVEAVDAEERTVTLKFPDGKPFEVAVPEDVPNLDQIQPGRKVDVTYMESLAVAIQPPGATPPKATVQQERGALGGGQGRYVADRVTVTAKVVSVDQKAHRVTLEGPKGKQHTIKVKDPKVREQLGSLQPGQSVQVTYTEAVAMSLRPEAG